MTAVAPPPNFQNIARQGWSGDDSRMFMTRKSVQRSNSSSSLASTASSNSTVSNASSQSNGVAPLPAGEGSTWARKKAPRGLWPASKTEPISGITTARPQSIASAGSGASATSAMTALHTPAPMVPSQHNGAVQAQQNGAPRPQTQESPAILHLIPMNGTFEHKTITVPFFPDVLRVGRQTNNRTIPTPLNGFFDSKVLSRQHAEIWADRNGKIWIRDVKSSNGTFVNGQRLSQENRDSDPHELREQDMLELGIDIVSEDQKMIVHHKVAARVEHAGIYTNTGSNMMDLNFGEIENPQLSNLMGTGSQQQLTNMRGRTPSQGSMNGQRLQGPAGPMGNINGMQPPRHPNFWLQPITMEQVVKKLNAEIKAARQQAHELQQTNNYINTILTTDPKKEPTKPSPMNSVKISPIKDLKTRFLEPPAPPPQQPLPQKPDAHLPSLKRVDTEKPKNVDSPARSETQMSTLTEALTSAKKEIESQGMRLRDLETLLNEERRAREDAEERANRLERESFKDRELSEPTIVNSDPSIAKPLVESEKEETIKENGSMSPNLADLATARLQQRLELMMSEMAEMKQLMEKYRERAETAEADRRSLAEMIESIRQDNEKMDSKQTKHRRRSNSEVARESTSATDVDGIKDEATGDVDGGEITIMNEREVGQDSAGAILRRAVHNRQPVVHENGSTSNKIPPALVTQLPRKNLTLSHGAPAMSILAVVAMGVAVMAYLNSLPKGER